MTADPVRVGVVGLGRSGWNIHVRALRDHPGFRIVAVSDPLPARRQEGIEQLGCAAYESPEKLFEDDNVELVIVATPSHTHADLTCAALERGKHVLVEKPMANTVDEVDRMIKTAQAADRLLSVYQIRRLDPDFLRVQDVIKSGVLGPIVLIRMTRHSYIRRSDWQTLRKFGGGMLNNWGAHIVDMGLQLLGGEYESVLADMKNVVSAGDAEDHIKVVLKGKETVVDVEVSSSVAYPGPEWFVVGKYGTLTGSTKELRWKYYDPAGVPMLTASEEPAPERRYQQPEQLPWIEESARLDTTTSVPQFYTLLRASLRDGAPLFVTPESVRQQIQLFAECRRQNGF